MHGAHFSENANVSKPDIRLDVALIIRSKGCDHAYHQAGGGPDIRVCGCGPFIRMPMATLANVQPSGGIKWLHDRNSD
jgi:hypothetical protein